MPEQQSFVLYIVVGSGSKSGSRQVVGAAPELVSEAGEPVLCCFLGAYRLTFEAAPQATFGSQEPFLACCQGAM